MSMPSTARLLFTLLCARIAFGFAYLAYVIRPSSVFWYYPLQRRWEWITKPSALAMDWYGRTGIALGAGLVIGVLALLMSRNGKIAAIVERPSFLRSIAHAGALVIALDFLWFAVSLWMRKINAPPLPPWYCPL